MPNFSIDKRVAEKSLRTASPLLSAALAIVQKNGGRTNLPAAMFERLKLLKVENWAEFYLEPQKLAVMSLLGVYTPKQLDGIGRNLKASSEAVQTKFWEDLLEYVTTDNWIEEAIDEYLQGMTLDDMRDELEEILSVADGEFKSDLVTRLQAALLGVTASFHNAMAMMAYGTQMSELVRLAVAGDMHSYFKAYHVDHTLEKVPFFAALHEQKKQDLDGNFFNALSRRRRSPLIPEKLKYPKLWFTFAYFDSMGLLPSKDGTGFTLEQLLDICVDMKIYGANYDKGIDDLSQRLKGYRELQKKLSGRKYIK